MRSLAFLGLVAGLHVGLPAQCNPVFTGGLQGTGVGGEVFATAVWDPDGVGPQAERYVVGGAFRTAGGSTVNHVATFDPATGTWAALGSGIIQSGSTARVHSLVPLANGTLYAGGLFTHAGGRRASNVARWDGAAWQPLGSGVDGIVRAMHVLANGDLVVGGDFTMAGGAPAANVARWDGSSWHDFGDPGRGVLGFGVDPHGRLIACGEFGVRFRGPTGVWGSFGGPNSRVAALDFLPNGDLVIAGHAQFTVPDGATAVGAARWNGLYWTTFGSLPAAAETLAVLPNGDVVAGCSVTVGLPSVYRYSGASWAPWFGVLSGFRTRAVTPLANGDLLVGGDFLSIDGVSANRVAVRTPSRITGLGGGIGDAVYCSAAIPGGDFVLGGRFTTIGGVSMRHVARWRSGSGFEALGSGTSGSVDQLVVLDNGDVIAHGAFTSAGGVTVPERLARWDGAAWSRLGAAGPGGAVDCIVKLPGNELVVSGSTGFSRWDGARWNLFSPPVSGSVLGMAVLPNGDLVATGAFQSIGGQGFSRIARWDGAMWQPLGSGLDGIGYAVFVRADGDVVAGGDFTSASGVPARGIARFDGASWHGLDNGINLFSSHGTAWTFLENRAGDLLVGGNFRNASGVAGTRGIARWDGVAWHGVAGGVDADSVRSLTRLTNGDIVVGGGFTQAGGQPAGNLVRITSDCPGSVRNTPVGGGCIGPLGPVELTATSLPLLGGTYAATATGYAANSTGFSILGVSTSPVSLASLHPNGVPHCDLVPTVDVPTLCVPVGNACVFAAAVPNEPSLLATQLHHQFLQLGFDGQGVWNSISSSNTLTLTIGSWY